MTADIPLLMKHTWIGFRNKHSDNSSNTRNNNEVKFRAGFCLLESQCKWGALVLQWPANPATLQMATTQRLLRWSFDDWLLPGCTGYSHCLAGLLPRVTSNQGGMLQNINIESDKLNMLFAEVYSTPSPGTSREYTELMLEKRGG
jgi:hypothetical protein